MLLISSCMKRALAMQGMHFTVHVQKDFILVEFASLMVSFFVLACFMCLGLIKKIGSSLLFGLLVYSLSVSLCAYLL